MENRLDNIVTFLNCALENNREYFCKEYECEYADLVSKYGFGYVDNNLSVCYIDGEDICIIPLTLETIEEKCSNAVTAEQQIKLIEELQGYGD